MLDQYIQMIIFILGVSALFMSQSKTPKERFIGCILGLCSQPFWFYTTFVNQQWGIFMACIFYTLSWLRGYLNAAEGVKECLTSKL